MRWFLWSVAGVLAVVILLGGGLVALARHDVVSWTRFGDGPDWEIGMLPCGVRFAERPWLLISFRATKKGGVPVTAVFGWRLRPWRHAWLPRD